MYFCLIMSRRSTSAALLKNIFRDLGVNVSIYVPDRILEGYGPSIEAMQKIKDQKTDLAHNGRLWICCF